MEDRQVHIYTGNGKGKTTAAVGLAVRALGAGWRVYMGQFIKDLPYHELSILKNQPHMTVELYGSGRGCFIGREPAQEDIDAAQMGLEKASAAMEAGYDLVILDEILVACALQLITEEEILTLLDGRPPRVELILTGRGCPEAVLERADLVTEMREVRHYYNTKGLLARDGIER